MIMPLRIRLSSGPGSPEGQANGQSHRFILFETIVLEKFQTKMMFSKHNLFFLMSKRDFGLILLLLCCSSQMDCVNIPLVPAIKAKLLIRNPTQPLVYNG